MLIGGAKPSLPFPGHYYCQCRSVGPISISRLNWTETFRQVLQGLAATAAAAALDQES